MSSMMPKSKDFKRANPRVVFFGTMAGLAISALPFAFKTVREREANVHSMREGECWGARVRLPRGARFLDTLPAAHTLALKGKLTLCFLTSVRRSANRRKGQREGGQVSSHDEEVRLKMVWGSRPIAGQCSGA